MTRPLDFPPSLEARLAAQRQPNASHLDPNNALLFTPPEEFQQLLDYEPRCIDSVLRHGRNSGAPPEAIWKALQCQNAIKVNFHQFETQLHHQSTPCPNMWVNEADAESLIEELVITACGSLKNFHSRSYLDRLVILCYVSGVYACKNQLCMRYKRRLKQVIPSCESWSGFYEWALGMTACTAAFLASALYPESVREPFIDERTSRAGVQVNLQRAAELVWERFRKFAAACVHVTHENGIIYNLGKSRLTFLPPCPGELHKHVFPRDEPSPIDVAEVVEVISWFRGCTTEGDGMVGWNLPPQWQDNRFIDVVIPVVARVSAWLQQSGFCQQRVWEVIRNSTGREMDLPAFAAALARHADKLVHPGHEACTPDFCEFTTLNFTRVTQLHKCHGAAASSCTQTPSRMFDQALLAESLRASDGSLTTAWSLDGRSLVPASGDGAEYVAISHVWSDGTGVGVWKAGQVNQCLWGFWVDKARQLRCRGIWWDTVCIPQDKVARAMAMNSMHMNYVSAKYTLVHDRYLLNIEWTDDGAPTLALVLSPWFTRGWTAVELFLSKRVKVLFKAPGGKGLVMKDLDMDILPNDRFLTSRAQRIAAYSIRRLRMELNTVNDLLVALRSRYTSWASDRPIIAGLLCGLTNLGSCSQQEIYKNILCELGEISYTNILHGLPTMTGPGFTWCPANLFDLPTGDTKHSLYIDEDRGTLFGLWDSLPVVENDVRTNRFTPYSSHPYVQSMIMAALREHRQCAVLLSRTDNMKGLLVRVMVTRRARGAISCEYIGCVNVRDWSIEGLTEHAFVIGDGAGMVPVEDAATELAKFDAPPVSS